MTQRERLEELRRRRTKGGSGRKKGEYTKRDTQKSKRDKDTSKHKSGGRERTTTSTLWYKREGKKTQDKQGHRHRTRAQIGHDRDTSTSKGGVGTQKANTRQEAAER